MYTWCTPRMPPDRFTESGNHVVSATRNTEARWLEGASTMAMAIHAVDGTGPMTLMNGCSQ